MAIFAGAGLTCFFLWLLTVPKSTKPRVERGGDSPRRGARFQHFCSSFYRQAATQVQRGQGRGRQGRGVGVRGGA